MKTKDIKGQSKSALLKTLKEKRDAFQAFKYELSGGKAKDVKKGRNIRKEIARILTELTVVAKSETPAVKVVTVKEKTVKKSKVTKAKK